MKVTIPGTPGSFLPCTSSIPVTYLSSGSCYFVNDIGEDDVLVVGLDADLFPLRVLPQAYVVAQERVTDAEQRRKKGCETQTLVKIGERVKY